MDVVTSTILASFQAIPYATPVAVGGLFFSMFCVKKFISDQKRRNARLPPGVVFFFLFFSLFCRFPSLFCPLLVRKFHGVCVIKGSDTDLMMMN